MNFNPFVTGMVVVLLAICCVTIFGCEKMMDVMDAATEVTDEEMSTETDETDDGASGEETDTEETTTETETDS